MSPNPSELPKNPRKESLFESRDCINVVVDGPGDTTVRPLRPLLRRQMEKRGGPDTPPASSGEK